MVNDNTLYYGDNLNILKELSSQGSFIDLIYIDPPFNSKRNYNILFEDLIQTKVNSEKTIALKEAFSDTWSNVSLSEELEEMADFDSLRLYKFLNNNREIFSDSQMSYLTMMSHRIYYMHKLLKDTGSFYLHCDPTMSHYLKIVCDIIFGNNNFRNEVVWCYDTGGVTPRHFSKKHDIILFYSKTTRYNFYVDNIRVEYKEKAKVKAKVIDGKEYLIKNPKGKIPLDYWSISPLTNTAKERLGYPTQKPEALLERIIKASSKEGDLVADFFCGCGTTITVAEKFNRRWIGVDINHLAIGLIEDKRLQLLKAVYEVRGFPADQAQAEKLATEKPFEFEQWVVEYVFKGHSTKKTRDGGFDGHMAFKVEKSRKICLVEVKGGSCNIGNLRGFADTIRNQKADLGIFICFKKQVTSGIKQYCDKQGYLSLEKEGVFVKGMFNIPYLSIITVENILDKEFPTWLTQYLDNMTY